jgi:hypothetical protein
MLIYNNFTPSGLSISQGNYFVKTPLYVMFHVVVFLSLYSLPVKQISKYRTGNPEGMALL